MLNGCSWGTRREWAVPPRAARCQRVFDVRHAPTFRSSIIIWVFYFSFLPSSRGRGAHVVGNNQTHPPFASGQTESSSVQCIQNSQVSSQLMALCWIRQLRISEGRVSFTRMTMPSCHFTRIHNVKHTSHYRCRDIFRGECAGACGGVGGGGCHTITTRQNMHHVPHSRHEHFMIAIRTEYSNCEGARRRSAASNL